MTGTVHVHKYVRFKKKKKRKKAYIPIIGDPIDCTLGEQQHLVGWASVEFLPG
jgi:hypothetical protein